MDQYKIRVFFNLKKLVFYMDPSTNNLSSKKVQQIIGCASSSTANLMHLPRATLSWEILKMEQANMIHPNFLPASQQSCVHLVLRWLDNLLWTNSKCGNEAEYIYFFESS